MNLTLYETIKTRLLGGGARQALGLCAKVTFFSLLAGALTLTLVNFRTNLNHPTQFALIVAAAAGGVVLLSGIAPRRLTLTEEGIIVQGVFSRPRFFRISDDMPVVIRSSRGIVEIVLDRTSCWIDEKQFGDIPSSLRGRMFGLESPT